MTVRGFARQVLVQLADPRGERRQASKVERELAEARAKLADLALTHRDQAAWGTELLHIVWGFARREHEQGTLVPAHAWAALAAVPAPVLAAANITLDGAPTDVVPAGGGEVTDGQIGAYYDEHIARMSAASGVPAEEIARARVRYIRDVRANPAALEQIAAQEPSR